MASETSTSRRQPDAPGPLVEGGLVLVRVAYHSRLYVDYAGQDISSIKEFVRTAYRDIAESKGGKPLSWDGDGGAFLFPVEGDESFDNCCEAALQMVEMVPALDADFRLPAYKDRSIRVRVICDAGMVACDERAPRGADDFVARLMRHERRVGADDRVTITDRVFCHLARDLRARFVGRSFSKELGVDVHTTPTLEGDEAPDTPADPRPEILPAVAEPARPAVVPPPASGPAESGPPRPPARPLGPWRLAAALAGAAVTGAALAGLSLGRGGIPPAPALAAQPSALAPAQAPTVQAPAPSPTPTPAPAAQPWNERVRSEAWLAWRRRIHEALSTSQVTEETLIGALKVGPPAVHNSSAESLRQDQAIGDVLLSYDGVKSVLSRRLGIDDHFLGTGLSNPVNVFDYGLASVHEYLIPNARDDDSKVLTIKLNPFSDKLEITVKELITKHIERDEAKEKLKQVVISQAEAKERGKAMIRFARLDISWYKNTLGRPDRVRVFASDLGEVWNLKVKDAADRSGYTFKGGDTFFIWIFVPGHPAEAIPATWGQVLDRLPDWMKEAEGKGG